MRAIVRNRTVEGNTISLSINEQALPTEIESHELKIKVKACGLSDFSRSPADRLCQSQSHELPVGHEVAGVVTQVGHAVKSYSVGDRVAGLLPLDWKYSGLAEECVISEYDTVHLADTVSYADAAGLLGDGVTAYTGLHYLGRVCAGDTVLVISAASSWQSIAVQLAHSWGAKVLGTVSSEKEKYHLDELSLPLEQVIEIQGKNGMLTSTIMEETGGMGVDVILSQTVRQFSEEEDSRVTGEGFSSPVPSKHDLISCLAVGGRWVTATPRLQLDPPHSEMLYLRGASVSFLFPGSWALSAAQYGRYQHMMKEIIENLSKRTLKPNIAKKISFEEAVDIPSSISSVYTTGKVVVEI